MSNIIYAPKSWNPCSARLTYDPIWPTQAPTPRTVRPGLWSAVNRVHMPARATWAGYGTSTNSVE